jgi:hypothetical protein
MFEGNGLGQRAAAPDICRTDSLFLEKFSLIRVWKFPVPLHREFRCKLLNPRVDQTLKSPWMAGISKIPC